MSSITNFLAGRRDARRGGASEGPATPTEHWLKDDIKTFLDGHGVEYPSDATKADLLDLVP